MIIGAHLPRLSVSNPEQGLELQCNKKIRDFMHPDFLSFKLFNN